MERPVLLLLFMTQPFLIRGKSVLKENGYTDLVVAISPDIPEDVEVINNVKNLMIEASRELYTATRNRAYFKQVKILLPKTWTSIQGDQTLEGESFETSELRIDRPSPVYKDSPYTLHGAGCGEPGSFLHITPAFLEDSSAYGNWGKVVVHEWAKLRWGVYEEHGYPGDEKFPMFFYKTTWTVSGQKNTLTPNFCVNSNIFGYEQDLVSGGPCTYNSDRLPDHNCYYYVTEQTDATSSYMSLPYLSNNRNFCDLTENYPHDRDLPTKQNLYCEGQSTWDVIVKSPDFANGANQPGNLANTEPEFVLVGSALDPVSYVLVMDVSSSMLPGANDNKADRAKAMLEAAKRWIKFEVQDGVNLGMVTFSDETKAKPFQNLTLIDAESRNELVAKLDLVYQEFLGKTCIGCGLNMAANYPGLLGGKRGQNILLITDGEQQCINPASDACITVADMTDVLAERNIRVITIALGPDADPEIEDLATKTGGKSFYVQDNVGSGDINGAFTGSSTFQPGDTMTNTDVNVYQNDWNMTEVEGGEVEMRDSFDIDTSLGRDVIFQVDITLPGSASDCAEDIAMTWISPNDDHDVFSGTFKCDRSNFGVFRQDLSSLVSPMPSGRWIYKLVVSQAMSVSVSVTAKSVDSSTDPIYTQCWINTGSQEIESEVDLKLAVMADVRQGNKPVIGAVVSALVERPMDINNVTYPAIEIELKDNGSGADNIKNDGIYARYFTHYTGKGRYSVKCQVVGSDDTKVNEGFITSKRSIPMTPGTPICCGSDTINEDSILTETGNFSRQAAAGSFQVPIDIDPSKDITPPSRVLDLSAKFSDEAITLEFTAPGDDLDSVDPPKLFQIKYSESAGNLTSENFDDDMFNTEISLDDLLPNSTMTPSNGGESVIIELDRSLFMEDIQYNFALKTQDNAFNWSPVSNIARVFLSTSFAPNMFPSLSVLVTCSVLSYSFQTFKAL